MAGLGRPGPGPRTAMPAWKREILERRRAKLAALSGGPGQGAAPEGQDEKLVLAESLGPLSENPFMRLESERRRGARPAQQLLELYRRVPGVRTIRADNILIIESAPGFPPAVPPAAGIRAAEVVVYETPQPGRVSRLLEKFDSPAAPRSRGSPERSRPGLPQLPVASASAATRAPTNRSLAPAPSVPLSPPAVPVSPVPVAPRAGQRSACCEPAHPDGTAGPGIRRSDFLQKTGSNSFTVHPRGLPRVAVNRSLSHGPVTQKSPAGPANGLSGSPPAPGKWKPKVESGKPSHPPPSQGTPSATPIGPPAFPAPSPASATPSQRRWVSSATSANDSFEIRPAPKPDVESIPIGDLQARALANLRVNSRNSFMLIPKRKAPSEAEGRQSEEPNGEVGWASRSQGLRAQLVSTVDGAPAPEGSPLAAEMQWAAREGGCPRPATAVTDRSVRWQRPSSPPPFLSTTVEAEPAEGLGLSGLAKNGQEPGRSGLPVTFIDEVDSEEEASQETKLPSSAVGLPSQYHLDLARPRHTSELPNRGSNTFIVVPKRKPETLQVPHFSQANGQSQQQEAEEQDADSLSGPHTALENTLKKRYPTVHEIEVIGGYLALQKSCLIKAGSSRKKMKISFNDNSLYTTFEYPSESSLEQEEAEDEEEGEKDGEGEEVDSEKPFSVFLPRATFVSSVGPEIPRLPDGSSGLSSYTPKHSMAFSKWQEQTVVQAPSEVELPPKEVMLTPASQNDLSDFRSEPALYF
ncbi:taperin isoform X1 [Cricetulus griseus]|uniref:Taperin isoform X2 n=1 Tax=Cricetulus griseus TaxID=10029 RepID=A0A9J7GCK1_CRIGR|nr:taperin isoform X2 [Cricetulus griseus]XP_035293348.1 taperin isoform X1 [Cricetulus griseus]